MFKRLLGSQPFVWIELEKFGYQFQSFWRCRRN